MEQAVLNKSQKIHQEIQSNFDGNNLDTSQISLIRQLDFVKKNGISHLYFFKDTNYGGHSTDPKSEKDI
ncbi:MAG: hypothetical protein B7Z16_02650 [Algoriphagus sp. 32-45-6]|nr:MAG: hypothetical protein B7Z16_02650 [Algoriphagus sp. 32-45-6]